MTDEEIIVRYRQKADKHWVGMLYKRYAHLVLGLCYKYLEDKEAAEDMTCEIFISLFEKLKYNEIQNFRPWLYTLSKNNCLMALRKRGRYPTGHLNGHEVDEGLSGLEIKQLKEEQLILLEKSIAQLNEDQRMCIEYFYLKKKSYQEVSETTGFPLKTVKSHIQNGKRNLKILLQQHEQFHGKV